MAAEAVPRFIAVDVTTECFFESWRRALDISDGPIQAINAGVVAHPTLVELAVVLQNVGLCDIAIPKCVQDGLNYGVLPICDPEKSLAIAISDLARVFFEAEL